MLKYYLKFQIPYNIIRQYLEAGKYQKIIFHVDLASISRGFYNKNVVDMEITNYMTTRQSPSIFFTEAKEFLGKLYSQFQSYSPKFSIFYDDGVCQQNKSLFNGYKDRASSLDKLLLEDTQLELFRQIKEFYYNEFEHRFTIPGVSKALFLKKYEADFLPWILLTYNLWNCADFKTLNVILSTDKDLLQCCQWKNVIQVMTLYSKKTSSIEFNVYNDETAISQLYPKFQRGVLTSQYIPLMLALSGDRADKIPGVEGIGDANAYKLIVANNIPPEIHQNTTFPSNLDSWKTQILRNYKLISFAEQLKRIPLSVIEDIKQFYQS